MLDRMNPDEKKRYIGQVMESFGMLLQTERTELEHGEISITTQERSVPARPGERRGRKVETGRRRITLDIVFTQVNQRRAYLEDGGDPRLVAG